MVQAYERVSSSSWAAFRDSHDASGHPEVAAGNMSRAAAYLEFADTFVDMIDTGASVTLNAFADYYQVASAGWESDDQFVQMMTGCWGLDLPALAPSLRPLGSMRDSAGGLYPPGSNNPLTGRNQAAENQQLAATEAFRARHAPEGFSTSAVSSDPTMKRLRELSDLQGERKHELLRRHLRAYDRPTTRGVLLLETFARAMR